MALIAPWVQVVPLFDPQMMNSIPSYGAPMSWSKPDTAITLWVPTLLLMRIAVPPFGSKVSNCIQL